jgi:hypothetical protein
MSLGTAILFTLRLFPAKIFLEDRGIVTDSEDSLVQGFAKIP